MHQKHSGLLVPFNKAISFCTAVATHKTVMGIHKTVTARFWPVSVCTFQDGGGDRGGAEGRGPKRLDLREETFRHPIPDLLIFSSLISAVLAAAVAVQSEGDLAQHDGPVVGSQPAHLF